MAERLVYTDTRKAIYVTVEQVEEDGVVITPQETRVEWFDREERRTQAVAALRAFLSDADIQLVLDNPNSTALTTQQLNRALKAIIRQHRRVAGVLVMLLRLADDAELLDPGDFA
jgi:hypothetical protein